MSNVHLDFTAIEEFKPSNLCIMSMGHIPEKAIKPIWSGMPMTSTSRQYLPLGYIANNGLGEELMYVGNSVFGTGMDANTKCSVFLPDSPPASQRVVFNIYITPATRVPNCVTVHAFNPAIVSTVTIPQFGWVRLLHTGWEL